MLGNKLGGGFLHLFYKPFSIIACRLIDVIGKKIKYKHYLFKKRLIHSYLRRVSFRKARFY